MEKELKDIKFKYPFRDYQKETLTMLNKYIYDEKIHVVAPPGAGKTILALELLLKIGNKTLILVPTIAIKEQWIERLQKDFINGDKKDLISSEIENPKIITIDTYQALYSLKRKGINVNEIIVQNNIKTIILDEAHHLRRVWQKTLKQITEKLSNCTMISLTATPPYDCENDFRTYMELCGIIDAKITIPQLVKSNCLCPHQDFIYFNLPNSKQEIELSEYTDKVNDFVHRLLNNKIFIDIIEKHDYIVNPELNTENILNEFEFFVSMMSFLKETNSNITQYELFVELNIPKLDFSKLNILLENIIFNKDNYEQNINYKQEIKNIKVELTNLGCIDKLNNVNLKYNKKISDLLSRNSGKLNSITEIINIEKSSLKEKLKLVVVTDFIKEEYLNIENEDDIKELGVIPIFRKVIKNNPDINVVVLTGTTIIIPTKLKENLIELAKKEFGILDEEIKITELSINSAYSKVELENKHDSFKVNLITKFFQQYNISVLIGTVALIGEGWDAPFVNALIMATYVSSYVTSNQLRGRAIRIDKEDESKFSNIWHLICLEKEKENYILGYDYDTLSKRFKTFEGIDSSKLKIESGIDRLNIYNRKYEKEEINLLNEYMIQESRNRERNAQIWKVGIENYQPLTTEKIEIPTMQKNSSHMEILKLTDYLNSHTKSIMIFFIVASILLIALPIDVNLKNSMHIIFAISIIAFVLKDYFQYRISTSYKGFIKMICKAVYKSLKKKKLIDKKAKCYFNFNQNNIEYGLKKASTYEQMVFLKNVKDSINFETDTRYIIKFYEIACAVPKQFDKNKADANIFMKYIKAPNKELIYTKTEKGKRILLEHKLKVLEND